MRINNVVPALTVLIILVLLVSLFFQSNKVSQLEEFRAWRTDTIKTYKDEKNRWIAEKMALEIGQKMSKELLQKELDQVKQDLDISRDQVASISKITTTTSQSINLDKDKPLVFSDPFTNITLTDTGSVYRLDFTFTDSLLITGHYERTKFWKSPQLRVKAISYNPNSKITGLDHIIINDSPTRFSIGLQVGYGLTLSGFSPYVGVGAQWELFRF